MLTRMIHTKLWEDEWFADLEKDERYLFVYLLINPLVNILHVYECTEKRMSTDTGIDRGAIKAIKEKLEAANKVRFYKSYVYLVNSHKYEKYEGPSNAAAKLKLWNQFSDDVQVWLQGIGYTPPTPL